MKSKLYCIILLLTSILISSCQSNENSPLYHLDQAVATTEALTEYTVLIKGGSDEESFDLMYSYSESKDALLYEGTHRIDGQTYFLIVYERDDTLYLKQDGSFAFVELPKEHYASHLIKAYLSEAESTYSGTFYNHLRDTLDEEHIILKVNQTIPQWSEPVTSLHFSFPANQVLPLYRDQLLTLYNDNIQAQVEQRVEAHRFLTESAGQSWDPQMDERLREHYSAFDLTQLETLISNLSISDVTYDFYVNSEGVIVYSRQSYTLTMDGHISDYIIEKQFESYTHTVDFPQLDEEAIIFYEDYKQGDE